MLNAFSVQSDVIPCTSSQRLKKTATDQREMLNDTKTLLFIRSFPQLIVLYMSN